MAAAPCLNSLPPFQNAAYCRPRGSSANAGVRFPDSYRIRLKYRPFRYWTYLTRSLTVDSGGPMPLVGSKDSRCHVCGPTNPLWLPVPFARDGAQGSQARYTARPEHPGGNGILHGGVPFALMDAD